MSNEKKVLIIGGGISGIKASLELKSHGIDSLILEAKDRLGGRLKTIEGLNSKYDVGASWFHDTLSNPLFDEENTLPVEERVKYHFDDMPHQVYDKDGKIPPDSRLSAISDEIGKYLELESQQNLDSDKPVYETMIKYFKSKKHLLTDKQIEHALAYKRYLELWHGIDIKRLSTKYSEIENNGRNALTMAYDTVLKRHTDQLSSDDYKLNKPIKAIERFDNNKKVKVTCVDGEVFISDYCIVTIPQSIIALDQSEEGSIKFTPSLPTRLIDSLKKCHFGALGKVVMEFDECFWGKEYERFLTLSSAPKGFIESIRNNDDESSSSIPELVSSTSPSSWDYPILFLNFAADFGQNSLVALTQSPLTEYLESNQDKAWEYLKPLVQTFSQKTEIPNPKNCFTTEWTLDPYQRGSYTACFPGDDPISVVLAFEEGFGNVRFAGEHTILEGSGCVHGAWLSGVREATYIINQLK